MLSSISTEQGGCRQRQLETSAALAAEGQEHRTPHTPQHALLFAESQLSSCERILISIDQQGQAGKHSHDPKPELHIRSLK